MSCAADSAVLVSDTDLDEIGEYDQVTGTSMSTFVTDADVDGPSSMVSTVPTVISTSAAVPRMP